MNLLVAAVMVATVASVVVQLAREDVPRWVGWTSLALVAAPVTLARVRTLPNAVRLGTGRDASEQQRALARSILHDHVLCFVAIAALLVLQLTVH